MLKPNPPAPVSEPVVRAAPFHLEGLAGIVVFDRLLGLLAGRFHRQRFGGQFGRFLGRSGQIETFERLRIRFFLGRFDHRGIGHLLNDDLSAHEQADDQQQHRMEKGADHPRGRVVHQPLLEAFGET